MKQHHESQNSNVLFKAINDLTEKQGLKPYVDSTDIVTLEVTLSPQTSIVFRDFTQSLYDSICDACALSGAKEIMELDEIRHYLLSLLHIRVKHCMGKPTTIRWTDEVYVPAFFSIILENIGITSDEDLGVTLQPKFDHPSAMDVDELARTSRKFQALSRMGLVCAQQMPRDRKGSWDFMAMQCVDNVVRRHDSDSHPVYGFLSSVVETRMIDTVLAPRVTYGCNETFRHLVKRFAHIGAVC